MFSAMTSTHSYESVGGSVSATTTSAEDEGGDSIESSITSITQRKRMVEGLFSLMTMAADEVGGSSGTPNSRPQSPSPDRDRDAMRRARRAARRRNGGGRGGLASRRRHRVAELQRLASTDTEDGTIDEDDDDDDDTTLDGCSSQSVGEDESDAEDETEDEEDNCSRTVDDNVSLPTAASASIVSLRSHTSEHSMPYGYRKLLDGLVFLADLKDNVKTKAGEAGTTIATVAASATFGGGGGDDDDDDVSWNSEDTERTVNTYNTSVDTAALQRRKRVGIAELLANGACVASTDQQFYMSTKQVQQSAKEQKRAERRLAASRIADLIAEEEAIAKRELVSSMEINEVVSKGDEGTEVHLDLEEVAFNTLTCHEGVTDGLASAKAGGKAAEQHLDLEDKAFGWLVDMSCYSKGVDDGDDEDSAHSLDADCESSSYEASSRPLFEDDEQKRPPFDASWDRPESEATTAAATNKKAERASVDRDTALTSASPRSSHPGGTAAEERRPRKDRPPKHSPIGAVSDAAASAGGGSWPVPFPRIDKAASKGSSPTDVNNYSHLSTEARQLLREFYGHQRSTPPVDKDDPPDGDAAAAAAAARGPRAGRGQEDDEGSCERPPEIRRTIQPRKLFADEEDQSGPQGFKDGSPPPAAVSVAQSSGMEEAWQPFPEAGEPARGHQKDGSSLDNLLGVFEDSFGGQPRTPATSMADVRTTSITPKSGSSAKFLRSAKEGQERQMNASMDAAVPSPGPSWSASLWSPNTCPDRADGTARSTRAHEKDDARKEKRQETPKGADPRAAIARKHLSSGKGSKLIKDAQERRKSALVDTIATPWGPSWSASSNHTYRSLQLAKMGMQVDAVAGRDGKTKREQQQTRKDKRDIDKKNDKDASTATRAAQNRSHNEARGKAGQGREEGYEVDEQQDNRRISLDKRKLQKALRYRSSQHHRLRREKSHGF